MDTRFEAVTDFGKWIKAKDKTVSETAKLLNVSRSYVWMLATGRAVPRAKMMAKIQAYTLGAVRAESWMNVARKL